MARLFIQIFSLILSLTITIAAQQTTGNLEGRILNPDGMPLPDVNIIVTSLSLQGTRGTTTNDMGYFRLLALPPGVYNLKITHIAYHNVSIDDIIVLVPWTRISRIL